MKNRIIWAVFIIMGFIILILDTPLNWKYFGNVIKELRIVLHRRSKYIEDDDYQLVHKNHIFKAWRRK